MLRYYADALSIAALTFAAAATCSAGPVSGQSSAERVDSIFQQWNRPDAPGCAVNVIKDGKPAYQRGYGMADLEHGIPNTPATVFHIASVSKQFTAFAVYLLAQDGKLDLGDDIRKYLPELHDFGRKITLRHLLHHQSGLWDQSNLLALAGWRMDDVITEDDILSLIRRERTLNFVPGDERLYSNTGYTLLALIVRRVSGKSLRTFAEERIFRPLGMTHTHFQEQYGELVKNRAYSYVPAGADAYRYVALSYSYAGSTSLLTTVEDLALWDRNFYDARVGGKNLVAATQAGSRLNDGKETGYAAGHYIRDYRGLATVGHGGDDAGYNASVLRFPEQHFSVLTLCNAANADAAELSKKVADIYLEGQFKSGSPLTETAPPVDVKIDPASLDALVGDYQSEAGWITTFTKENGRLMSSSKAGKAEAYPKSGNTFFLKVADAQYTFDKPEADGKVHRYVLPEDGKAIVSKRISRTENTPQQLEKYVGEFYSDELHVLYTATLKDGRLKLRLPREELDITATDADNFVGLFPIWKLHYTRSPGGVIDGFTIDNGRVRNVKFVKVDVVPVTR